MPTAAPAIQRILLVDDNEADNGLHAALLRRAGFAGELHSLDSGVTALEWLQQADLSSPTLIVLDIHMPGMDGFEFAAAAHQLTQGHPVRAVLMTTPHAAELHRQRALTLPLITQVTSKPLTPAQIAALLTA